MKTINFILSLTILSAACLMLGSCKDDDGPEIEEINSYPLAVGNTWKYRVTIERQLEGEKISTVIYYRTVKIVGEEEIGGKMAYKFETTETNYTDNNTRVDYYIEEDGDFKYYAYYDYQWWRRASEAAKILPQSPIPSYANRVEWEDELFVLDPPLVNYDYPIVEGKQWNRFPYQSTYMNTRKVGKGQFRSVEAGMFYSYDVAYEIENKDETGWRSHVEYISKSGVLKTEQKYEYSEQYDEGDTPKKVVRTQVDELISYELN